MDRTASPLQKGLGLLFCTAPVIRPSVRMLRDWPEGQMNYSRSSSAICGNMYMPCPTFKMDLASTSCFRAFCTMLMP